MAGPFGFEAMPGNSYVVGRVSTPTGGERTYYADADGMLWFQEIGESGGSSTLAGGRVNPGDPIPPEIRSELSPVVAANYPETGSGQTGGEQPSGGQGGSEQLGGGQGGGEGLLRQAASSTITAPSIGDVFTRALDRLPTSLSSKLDDDTKREIAAAMAGAMVTEGLTERAEARQSEKERQARESRSAFIQGRRFVNTAKGGYTEDAGHQGAQLARQGGGFTDFDSAGMRSVRAGAGGAGLLAQGKEGGAPDEGTVGSANQPINNFRTTMNVLREQRGY